MRYVQLIFSPTGGVRKAANLLSGAISEHFETIDLSLTLSGQKSSHFSERDVCLIAVPSFGGRVPEIVLTRLAQMHGGGARTLLLCVYGNRSDGDTLYELRDAARKAGFFPVAAVRAIAQHSIIPDIAAGRPDAEDARKLIQFGKEIRDKLPNLPAVPLPEKTLLQPFGGLRVHPHGSKKCTRCGKCAAVCPMNAIPRNHPMLTNETRCITCMRCTVVCPVHARRLSRLVTTLAGRKLKKNCAVRQEPELILSITSEGSEIHE